MDAVLLLFGGMTMTFAERMAANAAVPNGLELILGGAPAGQGQVQELPIGRLHPKENHTFRIRKDTEYFAALRESIRESGVRTPLLVRPHRELPGEYEIVAGHTRWTIGQLEGLTTLPCVVQQLSDAEADRLMGETNIQRPDWLPSERARTFAVWLRAVREESGIRERQRTDLTAATGLPQLRNRDLAAQKWGMSGQAFSIYVKLNELNAALLELVDEGRITVKAGYQLAFLPAEEQTELSTLLARYRLRVSEKQASELRRLGREAWGRTLGLERDRAAAEPVWKFSVPKAAVGVRGAGKYLNDPELAARIAAVVSAYVAEKAGDGKT